MRWTHAKRGLPSLVHPQGQGDAPLSVPIRFSTARGGFTLLEVIAGMALITLVIGGVYGIANGAIQLGTSMSEARIRENRITRFTAQWRDYLETLPPGTIWTAPIGSAGGGSSGKLLIEGGSSPFAWQKAVRLADAVEFRIDQSDRTDDLALFIRHLKRPERANLSDDYETMAEIALLENIEQMQWQFYDPDEDNEGWFSTWDPEKRPRPPLFMRLKLTFTNDPSVHEFTFWIANDLQSPSLVPPVQPEAAPRALRS
jgi:prepilin-type N-terminal cleavage/methylation domain-containing protein